MVTSFDKMRRCNYPGNRNSQQHSFSHRSGGGGGGPIVDVPASRPGVSNCFVFKSQLQEYAQKVGLPTPVYQTLREGPSHEPSFRSTVIVNGVRYDSLPGFFNRKGAEQSAAEIALMELSKCNDTDESISAPVHETGLCKNLLQEYAQKMNYAIPTYVCNREDTSGTGRAASFWCTVEIGGIQYIGAAAKNKKEAEIKAARTALLAIHTAGNNLSGKSQYTVVPCKRKVPEAAPPSQGTAKSKKAKKTRCKKKHQKQRGPDVSYVDDLGTQDSVQHLQNGLPDVQLPDCGRIHGSLEGSSQDSVQHLQNGLPDVQLPDCGQTHGSLEGSSQDNKSLNVDQPDKEVGPDSIAQVSANYDSNELAASSCELPSDGNSASANSTRQLAEGNRDHAANNMPPVINGPPASQPSDALVSDSGIGQAESELAAAIADTDDAREENHPGANEALAAHNSVDC